MALLAFTTIQELLPRQNLVPTSLRRAKVLKCSMHPGDDGVVSGSELPIRLSKTKSTKNTRIKFSSRTVKPLHAGDLSALDTMSFQHDDLAVLESPQDTVLLRNIFKMSNATGIGDAHNGLNRILSIFAASARTIVAVAISTNPPLWDNFTETVGGPRFVIAACMGVSAFLQALTGFGFAVVSVGGLSSLDWIVNSNIFDTIQPLVATLGAGTGWTLLFPDFRRVKWSDLMPLLVGSTLTLPVGVALASAVDTSAILHVVGALVTGYVAYSITGVQLPSVLGRPLGACLLGGLAGILGGAFDISGPPLVVYGEASKWSTADGTIKRNVLAIVTVNATLLVVYDAFIGRLDDPLYTDFMLHSIPAVVVGIVAGNMLSKRLDAAAFRKVVLGTCFVLGGKLLLS